jgi:hypothetical protein
MHGRQLLLDVLFASEPCQRLARRIGQESSRLKVHSASLATSTMMPLPIDSWALSADF